MLAAFLQILHVNVDDLAPDRLGGIDRQREILALLVYVEGRALVQRSFVHCFGNCLFFLLIVNKVRKNPQRATPTNFIDKLAQ